MVSKGILEVGPYKIKKLDRWSQQVQIYYDSHAVFAI
jgi:hypothetical protein